MGCLKRQNPQRIKSFVTHYDIIFFILERLGWKTMKLTALAIMKWNGDNTPIFLGMAADVSNFGCVNILRRSRPTRDMGSRLLLSPSHFGLADTSNEEPSRRV